MIPILPTLVPITPPCDALLRSVAPLTAAGQHAVLLLMLLSGGSLLLGSPRSAPAAAEALPVPLKVLRYAEHLVTRHDASGDGRLDASEAAQAGLPPEADADGDGILLAEELAGYIVQYGHRRRIRLMPAAEDTQRLPSLLPTGMATGARDTAADTDRATEMAEPELAAPDDPTVSAGERAAGRRYVVSEGRLPQGLPAWFVDRDLDGDGQLTQAEFSSNASPAALQQFRAYDLNSDGLITPRELVGPVRAGKRSASP